MKVLKVSIGNSSKEDEFVEFKNGNTSVPFYYRDEGIRIKIIQPYTSTIKMEEQLEEVKNLNLTQVVQTSFEDLKAFIDFIEKKKVIEVL